MNAIKKLFNKYQTMSIVTKATLWFFICNNLLKCLSLLTTPIFTRILSTEQFGIFNTYMSWVQIVTILSTLRLDYGIFNKGMTQFSDDKENYTASMQSTTSILTILLLILYLLFQSPINKITGLTTTLSLGLFVEVFFTNAISFWTIRQRYDFKYKCVILVSISMALCNTFFGIIAVLLTNHSGTGRIISTILIQCCFGCIIYVRNYIHSTQKFVLKYVKFAILFNLPLIPHYFASFILDQFDRIMIMKLANYSAVGIYSIAYSTGYAIKIITSTLNNTLLPWQYRKLKEQDYNTLSQCVHSITKFVLICFIIYMTFSPEVISLIASSEYRHAMYILPPVTASAFLIFLYELYANVEFFYGANKATMFIAIIGATINIILNYLFIPRLGYVAAAYTTLISYCFFTFVHYICMNRVVQKNTNSKRIFAFSNLLINMFTIIGYAIIVNFIFEYHLIRYGLAILLLIYVFLQKKEIFKFLTLLK